MVSTTAVKKFPILNIAWILLGSIGIIYHLFYLLRLWNLRSIADFSPAFIYVILFAIISIVSLVGGIGRLSRKNWATIVLAILSMGLFLYAVASIGYLLYIIISTKPTGINDLIISFSLNIYIFVVSLCTIVIFLKRD